MPLLQLHPHPIPSVNLRVDHNLECDFWQDDPGSRYLTWLYLDRIEQRREKKFLGPFPPPPPPFPTYQPYLKEKLESY